jgi:hypothetical protein
VGAVDVTVVMDGSFLAQTGKAGPSRGSVGVFEEALSDRPHTGVTFEVGEDGPPRWLDEVVRRLNVAVAAATAEGWPPMTHTAVISSLQALRRVMGLDSIRPSVTPTSEGGLQFEWHDAGWDVELEVDPNGNVNTWGRHQHNGVAFEGPFAATADSLRVAVKDITVHHRLDAT